MKLLTFEHPETGAPTPGLAFDDHWIIDLTQTSRSAGKPIIHSIDELILEGDDGIARAQEILAFAKAETAKASLIPMPSCKLLAPFHPRALRCFSVYPGHIQNVIRQKLKHEHGVLLRMATGFLTNMAPKRIKARPLYYKGVHLNIVGPEASIIRPPFGDRLDYELELGVIIGRGGKDIPAATALEHVFGYTIFNDVSARTQMSREMSGFGSAGPAKGKDFVNSNIIGPWIVTRDEIPDPQALEGIARINGKEIGRGRTGDMAHSVAQQIAYASYGENIYPGEFIGTGAMANCCGIEHWRFLEDGDEVDLEIKGIGQLTNQVAAKGART